MQSLSLPCVLLRVLGAVLVSALAALCAAAPSGAESAGSAPARRTPASGAPPGSTAAAAPLMTYVHRPDPSFRWSRVSSSSLPGGGNLVELSLQSQTWRGIPWTHHLLIVEPGPSARAAHDSHHTAMLYITGDYDGGATARVLSVFAAATGAPTAILYDVPNQPLYGGLLEDDLIAYTFVQYEQSGDLSWPLLFPMVKSATSAMTAVQQYTGAANPIHRFIVSGASKRGWTTWLTAAADPRVAGIIPIVYNNLNLRDQMPHQIATWGEYSEQIHAYVQSGLIKTMDSPTTRKLIDMADPYAVRTSLAMPKLIVNATNDRYWTLDAADLYFPELPGDKHLLYVPNNEHGIQDYNRVIRASAAFFNATVAGKRLPTVTASCEVRNGKCILSAASTTPPRSVTVWEATTPTGDFRNSIWTPHPAAAKGRGYQYTTLMPKSGHIALFAEATYGGALSYSLSSPIRVEPPIGK